MKLIDTNVTSDFTGKTRYITINYEAGLDEQIDLNRLEQMLQNLKLPAAEKAAPSFDVDTVIRTLKAPAIIATALIKEEAAPEAPAIVDPRTMFIRSINQHFAQIDLSDKQEVLNAVLEGEKQFLEGAKTMACTRELEVAMVAAVADRLNMEVDVAAQYIENHRRQSVPASTGEPSLEALWNQTMAKPQIQSKSQLIQKMVAALAIMTAVDGKTTVADMQAMADKLSGIVGAPEEWAMLKNPSVGSTKTKLQVLAPIVGNTVSVKVL